jgi:hypothetical protein
VQKDIAANEAEGKTEGNNNDKDKKE